MEILFEKAFERDIRKIGSRSVLHKLREVILHIKQATKISEIKNIRKIEGTKLFYRIKLGNYRIGIEISSNKVIFVSF